MATSTVPAERVRLAELIAALSLGVDLGFGQPMEHVLRQTLIALRVADRLGLGEIERSNVYYTGLLVNVGCHTDAHEQAKWFGDDIAMKAVKYEHGLRTPAGAVAMMRLIGSGNPPLHRVRIGLEFALSGRHEIEHMIEGHSAMARLFAEQLLLPLDVQVAVGSIYEQWDGKGWPGRLHGEAIPLAARLCNLAEFTEAAFRVGGIDAAVDLARSGSGSQFDPDLVTAMVDDAGPLFDGIDGDHMWDAVISSEPALARMVDGDELDRVLVAIADFVDLKTPHMLGHASAVAERSAGAAASLGLPTEDVRLVGRAGLVTGLGRLGVSNAIWDKPGPLGTGEWERVRMQPYLTERMLRQSGGLAPLGKLAAQLRERLDGSGYPRGLSGASISPAGRVLAAADAYQAMLEPRPYREPMTPAQAAKELAADVRAGRLDGDAVQAVLASAGHRTQRRRAGPAGLSPREIEVLRLLALGMSSKEISAKLVISPKTARNHIEHIYTKTGTTSRAAASLFAVQHGLVDPGVGLLEQT